MKDFAEISKPLNKITSDNVPFVWGDECEHAFDELKRKSISKPVLAYPKVDGNFTVEVDASKSAVGGVLSESNWPAHTVEAYSLALAVRHWHVYLAGKPFELYTDHNLLVHLRWQKDPRGKFTRWISEFKEFEYTVKCVPGKDNVKADALSRNRNASTFLPDSNWEQNNFANFTENQHFALQLHHEQENDPEIGIAKRSVASCVNKQLRI